MNASWVNINERFEAQSKREKYLIVSSVIAVLYFVWVLLLSPSLTEKKDILQERFNLVEKKSMTTSALSDIITKTLVDDPNKLKKNEINQLEEKIKNLNNDLKLLSAGLVLPEDLQVILRDVLSSNKEMKLLNLAVYKPKELQLYEGTVFFEDKNIDEKGEDIKKTGIKDTSEYKNIENIKQKTKIKSQGVGVYKHSVVVRLEGSYFDTLEYLRLLEQLTWKFYWSELRYEVTNYPNAIITFEVYTLSTLSGLSNE